MTDAGGTVMSKLVVALAAAAALATQVTPADACEPAPNCGNTYCYSSPTAIVAGRVVARQTAMSPPTITVEIASVHGDAGSLVAGMTAELPVVYDFLFADADLNRTYYLMARPATDGALEVVQRIDPTDPFAVDCFGASAPAATVADLVLSPTCFDTLEPNYEDPCAGGCSARPGTTGGAAGGSILAALGLVALGARRRRADRVRARRRSP
jgi:hypothetical protein